MTVATAACEARTHRSRIHPSGFGFERVPCGQVVGLRSFVDAQGVTRRHCSLEGHRYDVERTFGVAQPVEPDWKLA
jgi:hypothetical protein